MDVNDPMEDYILSTLTHTLYISERPFEDFRICSPKFLETMQTTFDLVFLEIVYQLSPSDAIVKMVPSLFLSVPSDANSYFFRPVSKCKTESHELGVQFSRVFRNRLLRPHSVWPTRSSHIA